MKTASVATALLFVVCLAVLLPACGDDEGGAPTAEPSPTPAGEEATAAPAAAKIAFVSDRDGNREIYVMNPDGSGQTRLTNTPDDEWSPAWSPDRSKIAFVVGHEDDYDLYVMDADGANRSRLTTNPEGRTGWAEREESPTWSPDGKKIAFARAGEVYVINADGTGEVDLTPDIAISSVYSPTWSPDGRKIAFLVGGGTLDCPDDPISQCILVTDADGSNPSMLGAPGPWGQLTWSPDGKKMAYVGYPGQAAWINVIDVDTGTTTTLSPKDTIVDDSPAWSPDSSRIAFSHRASSTQLEGFDFEIYVMKADGTERINLTNNPGADDGGPAWSP